jgi:hypothetical protein
MIKPYAGPWDQNAKNHLLRRASFLRTISDNFSPGNYSIEEAVDALLYIPSTQPEPIKNYKDEELGGAADLDVKYGEPWRWSATHNLTLSNYRVGSLKGMIIENMLTTVNIFPKLFMFLHNHFCTSFGKSAEVKYWKEFGSRDMFFQLSFVDKFIDMLFDVSVNTSMLVYLNGYLNNKEQPDENYAREFFELFTLGTGNYTEDDIKEAARLLTGFRISLTGIGSVADVREHDTTAAEFSSHFDYAYIPVGHDPYDALRFIIMMVKESQGPTMAKHICRKMYRWFVGYDINQVIEDTYIKDLADIFMQKWSIREVLKAIFTSDHFYRMAGVQIKSPIDYVTRLMGDLNIQFSPDIETRYRQYDYLNKSAEKMGQQVGEFPNVKGYKAYYQDPFFYKDWITTGSITERSRFLDEVLRGDIVGPVNMISLLGIFCPEPEDPNQVVNYACRHFLAVDIPAETKTEIKNIYLLNGLNDDAYWTRAWIRWMETGSQEAANVLQTRLEATIRYIISSPEYQLQ